MAINPTQNGINPLRGLNYDPRLTDAENAEMDLRLKQLRKSVGRAKKGYSTAYTPEIDTFTESKHYEPGTPGFEKGMSRYDSKGDVLSPVTSFEDLNQRRYENQPWYDVAANGIAKAVGRAATSFITGVAGGVAGIADFAYEGLANGEWNAARLIDNPLSNALADIDDWANENFVNYKSIIQKQNEENGEWYNNLGSLNMVMDDIVTNFGFIVGMGAASAVTGGIGGAVAGAARRGAAGALRAARRSGNMAKLWGATKAAGIVHKYGYPTAKAVTLFNSSAGEAALEGLGVKREMMQEETQRINNTIDQHIAEDPNIRALDSEYQAQMQMLEQQYYMRPKGAEYEQQKAAITQQYQQQRNALSQEWETRRQAALQEMDASAERAGMATALLNMAILVPSNFNMYGRMIDKAFRNAEKSAGKSWAVRNAQINTRNSIGQRNITGDIRGKTWDQIRNAKKNYGSRTFLGNEAKRVGSTMFSEGIYEEMGQSAASTGAKYYHEWANPDNYWRARLDPDSIDQVTDGSHDFLQALGQGFKETYGNIDGWREGFIGGITGGLFGGASIATEWRDTRAARRGAKDLNKQLQNDRLPNLLQHIVAQGFHDNVKQGYAAMNNQRDWKTEDDKAAYALVSSFARAGRMDDLHHLINSYTDQMSDDDIQSMIDAGTRRVSSQEQINQMKQEIRKNTSEKVEALLKDGASMDDYMRAQGSVQAAADAVTQAEQAVEAARQKAVDTSGDIRWMQKSESALRNQARSARRVQNKAIARDIVAAMDALEMAREKHRNAKSAVSAMMASPESQQGIDAALAEYEELNNRADNSAPEEYLEGPFVDNSGSNTMQIDEVREQLKHNQDRIQQVVDRYKNAVEKVNRDTRGTLSKEQEDYLAYTQFMAESSGVRAQELVQKWRDFLPEVVTIRHKSAKAAAKMFGIDEGEVVEDPDNPGFYRVSTKKMTDEQFANFVLHGLLKQSHVKSKNDTGDGSETNNLRTSLADEALNAVDKEMERTGRRDKFDRDELRRDFEDIEDHFKKNKAFADAYMDALSNPENVMSAKQKFLRNLKKRYDKTKAKLRQKQMSIQELGDLSDDEMQGLDAYHFGLAKAEKIRRRIKDFWDSRKDNIYDKIEKAFDGITDPDVRAEIIQRVRDTILARMSEYEEEGPVDVDAEEVSMMIDLNDILPEDDDLWDQINPKTKKAIQDGLDAINDLLGKLRKNAKSLLKSLRNKFDKLRGLADDFSEKISSNSTVESIRDAVTQLISGSLTDEQKSKLLEYADAIKEKINKITEAAGPGYKAAVRMLKSLLSKIEQCLKQNNIMRDNDTDPSESSQPSAEPKRTRRRSEPQRPVDVADSESDEHLQNPSLEVEESAIEFHEEIEQGSLVTDDIWQSTTGEFARRSNFTYQPYHTIVEQYLNNLPEGTSEDDVITIKEFEGKGDKHTVADWRKYAKRSRIVWERLENAGAFGYIDSGKVKSGDEIGFLLSKHDGVFVVYLTHNGNIIGDLSDPEYGATGSGLTEMFQKFREEYGDSTGDVKSKYHTTAANVYAGFMRYEQKKNGKVPTRTIASFGKAAKGLQFFVHGVSNPSTDTRDVIGRGAIGQPFVLIPTPANDGLTRNHAVPVSTHPIEQNGKEMQVIRALLNSNLPEDRKRAFLNHFLNCKGIVMQEIENSELHKQLHLSDKVEPVTQITVITRNVHNGGEVRSTITIPKDSSQQVIIENGDALRANVSWALLNGVQGVPTYSEVVKDSPSLPQTYNDFLKEICHTSLTDLNVHNSWITVNKLQFDKDGNATIVPDPSESHTAFTTTGTDSVVVRDPILGESYKITLNKSGVGKIGDSPVIGVVKIQVSKNGRRFRTETMSEATRARLLPVIATAVAQVTNAKNGDTVQFMLDNVLYEGKKTSKSSVGNVVVSDNNLDNRAIDGRLYNSLRSVLSSFSETKKSLDDILKHWFRSRQIKKNSDEYNALKTILEAMKDGKRSFNGIPRSVKIAILNARLPKTQDQEQGVLITRKLLERLSTTARGKFKIITDQAEGQRIIDQWKAGKAPDGVRMFVKNSKTVYGFAYKGNIYLDPDVMRPETLIHEYTHLWTEVLRSTNKPLWDRLVKDMQATSMWDKVVKKYKHLKTDDDIADEVFAQLSGKEGEKWLRNLLKEEADTVGDNIDSQFEGVVAKMRSIAKEFIDYVKRVILGVPAETRTLGEVMQEMVWRDMLSDNPLDNFDKIAREADPETPATEEPAAVLPPNTYRVSDCVSEDGTVDEAIDMNGLEVVEINGEKCFVIPDGTELEDFGLSKPGSVKPMMDVTEEVPEFEGLDNNLVSNISTLVDDGTIDQPAGAAISALIKRLDEGQQRNYASVEDAALAMKLCLTEEQRNKLWKQMSTYMVTKGLYRHQIMAHVQHLFNRYMAEGSVGDEVLDAMFSELKSGISDLISNRESVSSAADMFSATHVTYSATPIDIISQLTDKELGYAHSESLNLLSEQDKHYLSLAGIPEQVYKALSDESKERIRKCVL